MKKIYILLCLFLLIGTSYAQTESTSDSETDQTGTFGIRAGIGTDINLGIAYGAGFNYRLKKNMELGLVFFGGKFSETSDNGFNVYEILVDPETHGFILP